jgi:hypothetical protein
MLPLFIYLFLILTVVEELTTDEFLGKIRAYKLLGKIFTKS